MLSKRIENRYANMEEVLVAMSPYAEGADLQRIADQLCGRPHEQPTDAETPTTGLFTRRRALTGIAAGLALALVGRRFLPTDDRQMLQFEVWRPIQSTKPDRILSDSKATFEFDAATSEYTISANKCSIYPTGRPVHSTFSMEVDVTLLTEESTAGLFFAYRPEKQETGTHHPFETVYLQKSGNDLILKWSRIRWDYSTLESLVEEDPLGRTKLSLPTHTDPYTFTVELGSSAIPTVSVSGQRIDNNRWQLSHAGTIASRMAKTELGAQFDGQVGLFVARSKASFKQPRLKYIE
jgi:hypothetical protein